MKKNKINISLHPVAKEFHYERNSPLKPEDFTLGSKKKIWWQCSKNSDHEWQAAVFSRVRGNGCPFCSGQKPSSENNLSLHPVAKEFHYERNKPLKPEDFTLKSGKKIWWICDKGHEWEACIADRTRDCLFYVCCKCRNEENNLSLHSVSKEFHYERNSPLKPENFTQKSNKKIWWKCSQNPEHEWEAKIADRTKGNNCPYCPGKGRRSPSKKNNLSLHPVASEFHYERNSPLKPEDFTLSSGKKIWWKCSKNPEHEWETSISNRNSKHNQNNCPFCGFAGTSKAEQEVLDFIKSIYDREIIHRYKLDGVEADIYLPDKNLAIEYNGLYWHSSLFKDKNYHYTKYNFFKEKGIQLYYIWEDQWNFCREEIESHISRLIVNNAKILFGEETCFYTDFRFVSKFKKANMVELHGYGSWGIKGKLIDPYKRRPPCKKK